MSVFPVLAKILKFVILNPLPACVGMVRVAICIVLYLYLLKVGKSTDSLLKKRKYEKKIKKTPARYVISIQISGERTAAGFVITVFTL